MCKKGPKLCEGSTVHSTQRVCKWQRGDSKNARYIHLFRSFKDVQHVASSDHEWLDWLRNANDLPGQSQAHADVCGYGGGPEDALCY